MENPYNKVTAEIREVLSMLIKMMSNPSIEMKLFKNVMAVYVIWQHDLHAAELESINYLVRRGL